jgi:hypothetical protein
VAAQGEVISRQRALTARIVLDPFEERLFQG